jgi:hypothetical protein
MKFRRHALLLAAVFMIGPDFARISAQTAGQFQDFTLVLETPRLNMSSSSRFRLSLHLRTQRRNLS